MRSTYSVCVSAVSSTGFESVSDSTDGSVFAGASAENCLLQPFKDTIIASVQTPAIVALFQRGAFFVSFSFSFISASSLLSAALFSATSMFCFLISSFKLFFISRSSLNCIFPNILL